MKQSYIINLFFPAVHSLSSGFVATISSIIFNFFPNSSVSFLSPAYIRFSMIYMFRHGTSIFPLICINPIGSIGIVGIKFDDKQDGKMINRTFLTNKLIQKRMIQEIGQLQGSVELVKVEKRNEPSVLCQSTFQ